MSASVRTAEANRALVEDLLKRPLSEQATELGTYPKVKRDQIGNRLARELLINDDYISKTAEEAAAYRAALPPIHQFFVASILRKGVVLTKKKSASPSGSPTRKKSASPPTSRFGSSASKHRRTADAFTAVARSAPVISPYERRLKAFRLQGLPFRYLAELTGAAEDTAVVSRYEKINLVKNFYGRDFPTLTEEDSQLVADLFSLDRGIAGAARDAAMTRIRAQFLRKKAALLEDIKARFVAPFPLDYTVDHIKTGPMSAALSDVLLEPLENRIPVKKYTTPAELQQLVELGAQADYSAPEHYPAIKAELVPLLERLGKRAAARKNHNTTRKSQYGLRSKSGSANVEEAEKIYLAKQMKVLGNGTLTWAQKQNALRALGSTRKNYFADAPFTGPLIDTHGYKQHLGECSTDAILQTLQQGAPWAPTVQETLYNGTLATFTALYEKVLGCPGFHPEQEDMMELILNMQERFKLHYTAKKHEEVCILPLDFRHIAPIMKRKLRKSAELGPAIKQNAAIATKSSYSDFTIYIPHIFQLLLNFFGLPFQCYIRDTTYHNKKHHTAFINHDIQYKRYEHHAFILRSDNHPPSEITLQILPNPTKPGHFTSIYKSLDGTWSYYDNNVGIMALHDTLMRDILNETNSGYVVGFTYTTVGPSTTISFYKIPYYNKSDEEELETKPIEKWTGDKWTTNNFGDFFNETDEVFLFTNTVHVIAKGGEPGYKGRFVDDLV
jgi:hypothetical protein